MLLLCQIEMACLSLKWPMIMLQSTL
ncbi:hypothetical protein E2I00_012760 [Balaenoptera physalus]|uniref:Uncharacterized protein n=1 Tax=Balaenoptera physalus TaxID=9770 RepID=A0A643AS42_BALPH|nr:hypothetical protein E2I00_012760 [Balaenoptera physalus]